MTLPARLIPSAALLAMAAGCHGAASQDLTGCLALGPERFDLRIAPDQVVFVEASREVMAQIKALQGDAPLLVTPVRVKAVVRQHAQAGPAGKYGAIAKVTELTVSSDRTLCQ